MRHDAWEPSPSSSLPAGDRPRLHTVLLVPDPTFVARVSHLADRHVSVQGGNLIVEHVSPPVAAAIDAARATHGGCPMAFLARSEPEAVEALAAGADEAMHLPVIDLPGVLNLVDRTLVRAARRRSQEREQESVAQAEKLAALGAIVASVAHEINNPLTAVLLSLEALATDVRPWTAMAAELRALVARGSGASATELRTLASPLRPESSALDTKAIIDEATTGARTIADIVQDLLVFARGSPDEAPRLVQVPELLDQVLRIVGHQLKGHGIVERDDAPDLPPILVPRSRVALVITNILVNASHAIREVESPCHRIRISTRADDEAVAISISDTGPGIPPESIGHIFDPFFTTKRESAGTGLGLSISRATLRKLGGDLIVESVHGEGATFVVLIPLPDPAAVEQSIRKSRGAISSRPARGRATVLLVDDDERVLRAYSRVLHGRYDLLLAADGQEAIDLLQSGSTPDAIVSDLVMPMVDGMRLYRWLEQERPALAERTLFVSAATSATTAAFLDRFESRGFRKPIAREVLIEAIESVLLRRPPVLPG